MLMYFYESCHIFQSRILLQRVVFYIFATLFDVRFHSSS